MILLVSLFQIAFMLTMFSFNADSMFPEIENYQKMGEIENYDPDNLYDIINGAADSYLKYDFKELNLMRYKGDADQFLQIEIYRHSNNITAFGIYSSEKPSEGNWIDVGAQGYHESKILNFYKGKYYVKLMGLRIDNSNEFLLTVAKNVSEMLEGNNEIPSVLKSFPLNGKIKNSEQYIHQNFLGYKSLSEAFTIDYKVDNKEFKMFFIQKQDVSDCRNMLYDYITSIKLDEEIIKEGSIKIEDPYQGEFNILWRDKTIIGLLNCKDSKINNKYLEEMSKSLKMNY